jgi:hypothetical protein
MLKLDQLMKVLAEVLMVSFEPAVVKEAVPWAMVPPVGLAQAVEQKRRRQKTEKLIPQSGTDKLKLKQRSFKRAAERDDILKRPDAVRRIVTAGILPAVEPGVLPGGSTARRLGMLDLFCTSGKNPGLGPGGRMPPSTAGGTPAATVVAGVVPGVGGRSKWCFIYPVLWLSLNP